MDKAWTTLFTSCVVVALLASSSYAQPACSRYSFNPSRFHAQCIDLPVLNSFLYWSYNSTSKIVNLAYRHTGTSSSRWVAWALNPSGKQMAGSQCLVAFQNSTGSIRAYTSPIGSGTPTLEEGSLSFGVSNLSASLVGNEWIIFAELHLPDDLLSVDQVWQEGPMNGDTPGRHPTAGDNMRSFSSINFRTGQIALSGDSFYSRERRENIHGILNAVSWGILMPLGAMMARYLKVFKFANPAWFYLHIACQVSGYIVGVAGWATGMKLGMESNPLNRDYLHRDIGIALFSLATLQMFALLLRPKPDHKYRRYWNIYHHSVGYAIIGMSVFNVLKGLGLLDPQLQWWHAYIFTAISMGIASAILEAITWTIVIKRKRRNKQKQPAGINGGSVHGAGTQQTSEV